MQHTETILYAEDSADDRFFIEKAFKKLTVSVEVRFVEDGGEAIDYMEGAGKFGDRAANPLPTVIFLDIKMPRVDGFKVMEWLKANESFRRIPVVMISSSEMQGDIDRAYALGASAYLVKPANLNELQRLFKVTGEFFVEHVEKPSRPSAYS